MGPVRNVQCRPSEPARYRVVVLTSYVPAGAQSTRTAQKQSGSYNTVRRSGEFVVLEKVFRVAAAEENKTYLREGCILFKKRRNCD